MVQARAPLAGGLFLLFAVVRCTSFGTSEPSHHPGPCRILFTAQTSSPVRERSLVKEGALLFFRIDDEVRLVDARRK